MSEIDRVMLIKADAGNNNNKFYDIKLLGDNTVHARYGRVGTDGQTKSYRGGRAKFDKIIAEKTAPENPKSKKGGYRLAQVVIGGVSSVAPSSLAQAAKEQIKYSNCRDTEDLIKKLVQWNVHQITANSTMTVNIGSGQIELPSGMGVLSASAIDEARKVLREIKKLSQPKKRTANDKKFASLVNDYLMLVPQKLPSQKGWIKTIFSTPEEFSAQENLLDSLEATLSAIKSDNRTSEVEKLFDLELTKVDDSAVVNKIKSLFQKTKSGVHQSSQLKVKTVYSINIGYMKDRFEKCPLDNLKELWHGTGVGNLLSILKNGLIIPAHASHGRLYGNGVYFSDMSTKALNYASGYWSGSYNSNCFMFLAEVKMGKTYTPDGYGSRYRGSGSFPVNGYDSTFAKAGKSGVANNEMIVYSLEQVNLRYLVEFES